MSIAQKAASGAAWNLVTGIGSQAFGLISTLLLTRFIAPAEYGEVSAATICVGSAAMFSHIGFGQYIIAKKATPEESFHAMVYHLALGVVAIGGVFLLRERVGVMIDAPRMVRFVPGMALAQMIERFAYVPERTLVRDMKFRAVALTRSTSDIAFAVVALALAPWLAGMAIVVGNLVRYVLLVAQTMWRADRHQWLAPVKLDRVTTRNLFSYSLPLSLSNLAEYASTRWDNLMVSRYHGPAVMGIYNLAYNLANTPTGAVAEQIGDVLLPSFAKMDPRSRRWGLFRATSLMALLVFPLAVGLGAIAPTVVHTMFDKRWIELAPMLMILAMMSVVRPVTWTLVAFVQAQQRPRAIMVLAVFKVVVMLGLLATLGRLGPRWACGAVGVAFALHTAAYTIMVWRQDKLDVVAFLGAAIRPLLACTPMLAAVVGVRWALPAVGLTNGWATLAVEVVVGGAVYIGAAFVFARAAADDLLGVLKKMIKRS